LLLGDDLVLRVRTAMTSIDREYRRLGYEREAVLMALGAPPSPVDYYHFACRP